MLLLLDYFRRVSIETPDTLEAHAVIDAESRRQGVGMGKNDLVDRGDRPRNRIPPHYAGPGL